MKKIRWTDRVKDEVLQKINGERNITPTIKRRKNNWNCYILRWTRLPNTLLEERHKER